MFFKSMTADVSVAYHSWVAKKIFNSRCSKMTNLAFLNTFGKPSLQKIMKTYV